MNEWLRTLANLFGDNRYAANGVCLSSDSIIINLFMVANITITISCFVVGGAMLANRVSVVRFLRWVFFEPRLVLLLGLFIVLIGANYSAMTISLFVGTHYLDAFTRVLLMGLSIAIGAKTARAFWFKKKLPSLVEALEIPMAEPYSAKGIHPPSHE